MMTGEIGDKAHAAYPQWAIAAVLAIYDQMSRGHSTGGSEAVAKILDQFPDAGEEARRDLEHYAAMVLREMINVFLRGVAGAFTSPMGRGRIAPGDAKHRPVRSG